MEREMAASFLITHRRMRSVDGLHDHVGWVKLDGADVLARNEVFAWMERGNEFRTAAPDGHSARTVHVRCRLCSQDYLRSDRDLSEADDLDGVPLF
jgi:hypothetical protein